MRGRDNQWTVLSTRGYAPILKGQYVAERVVFRESPLTKENHGKMPEPRYST
jgi:hypothetical protein